MLESDLVELIQKIASFEAEGQTIEVKAAHKGCPQRLYDTLSSFSNQDDGGVIVFGIDEKSDYQVCGVYDAQDLQKQLTEQCNQMSPKIRAVFTMVDIDGKQVASAEIPGIDVADRPCFYAGKGRIKGSYVRVGEADEPMSEYEVYSYEAYRKKYKDEVCVVDRATLDALDKSLLAAFLTRLKSDKPNLSRMEDSDICELMSITHGGVPTVAGVMLFSLYPQAFFPQLAIIATVVPGVSVGEVGEAGERFTDNKRIEGTLFDQVDEALQFVRANMRTKTVVSATDAKRRDVPDYPIEAVRELILNAVIHRDYSVHTQGMPVQVQLFSDRLEISNPGGLYGRLTVDQLGKVQPDTRNPVIANAMEVMGKTENRYSGIPTVRRLAQEFGLPEPEFVDARGEFKVILRKASKALGTKEDVEETNIVLTEKDGEILAFCADFKSRNQIAEHLGIGADYAMRKYVKPLVKANMLELEDKANPRSHSQRYRTSTRGYSFL